MTQWGISFWALPLPAIFALKSRKLNTRDAWSALPTLLHVTATNDSWRSPICIGIYGMTATLWSPKECRKNLTCSIRARIRRRLLFWPFISECRCVVPFSRTTFFAWWEYLRTPPPVWNHINQAAELTSDICFLGTQLRPCENQPKPPATQGKICETIFSVAALFTERTMTQLVTPISLLNHVNQVSIC